MVKMIPTFWRHPTCATMVLLGVPTTATAQMPDVTYTQCNTCGIDPYIAPAGHGAGIAIEDINGDGHPDMFVPHGVGSDHRLYLNDGDSTFTECAAAHGLAEGFEARVALWIDYDGDGDLDLLTGNDRPTEPSTFRLFRHDPGMQFVDVTLEAGLWMELPAAITTGAVARTGLSAGDLTGNGYLDVVAAIWNGQALLLMNNGDGTFTIAPEETLYSDGPNTYQPLLYDFDRDGWLDIYCTVDFARNLLFLNNGDGTFCNVAEAADADNNMNDMGATLGDYDNDGDIDIYLTVIDVADIPHMHNVLLRNDSDETGLRFTDVTTIMSVESPGWGWGCTFLDADLDGWLDLAATNGWSNAPWTDDITRFFWNRNGSDKAFLQRHDEVGLTDDYWGSGLVAVDLERDGDLDIVQTCMDGPLRVMKAQLSGPGDDRWLIVKPRMPGTANKWAIGAEVTLFCNGLPMQTRIISAGTSFLSQEPAEAFFGLHTAGTAASICVRWPDGTETCIENIAADQVVQIDKPMPTQPGDADGDLDVDLADLLMVIGNWGSAGPDGDVNNDGSVALDDLLMVIGNWGAGG